MLSRHLDQLNAIKNLNNEFLSYCLSKYIDTGKLKEKIKDSLKLLLNKKDFNESNEINFITNVGYIPSHEIKEITFKINFGADLNILEIIYKKGFDGKLKSNIKKIFEKSSLKLNTTNKEMIEISNELDTVVKKLDSIVNDIMINEIKDFLYLKAIMIQLYGRVELLNNKVFFNKLYGDELFVLITNIVKVSSEEFKLSLEVNHNNENIAFNLLLVPEEILKYSSISVFNMIYNIEKDSYDLKIDLIDMNSIIKIDNDVKKNLGKFKNFVLNTFKAF